MIIMHNACKMSESKAGKPKPSPREPCLSKQRCCCRTGAQGPSSAKISPCWLWALPLQKLCTISQNTPLMVDQGPCRAVWILKGCS